MLRMENRTAGAPHQPWAERRAPLLDAFVDLGASSWISSARAAYDLGTAHAGGAGPIYHQVLVAHLLSVPRHGHRARLAKLMDSVTPVTRGK